MAEWKDETFFADHNSNIKYMYTWKSENRRTKILGATNSDDMMMRKVPWETSQFSRTFFLFLGDAFWIVKKPFLDEND